MTIIDPGHVYTIDELDGTSSNNIIQFVKREGTNYPGNVGKQAGTNCQEIMRVLINRLQYLDNQIYDQSNTACIDYLRRCIWHLEYRAAKRHGRVLDVDHLEGIENEPHCNECGHIHTGYCVRSK